MTDIGTPTADDAAPDLTIFFPAYNEVEGLERTVVAAIEAGNLLVGLGEIDDYEVLVVDDASTDGTGDLADALAARHEEVRAVHHTVNRKLGGSIRTGLAEARGRWLLYTDADLPFDLFELEKAFRLLRHYDADIVAIYRHDRTGEGLRRLVYSYAYNSLIHTALGLRVRDVNFAGKLIRREVLDAVTLHSEGSFIDVELLAKAQRRGFRIIQFGVDYFPRSRGVSTLSSAPVILKMLREMAAIVPEIRADGHRVRPL